MSSVLRNLRSVVKFSYSAYRYKYQSPDIQQPGMASESTSDYKTAKSVYDFSAQDGQGNDISLEKYRGKVLLIVNIASKCGLTKSNYEEMTQLSKQYEDKEFKILSFPCNQFGSQMPEKDGEEMVCHLRNANAEVGDVFAKVNVNGDEAHPLYKYLKHKQGGNLGSFIKWNFTKFLVDKEGQPVGRYAPTTNPLDIAKDIDKLL
ncbi:uncharacterized protein LOC131431613 isoform X2 [Malaya genurostris]|uniref:uncharacterized protein LOC131431613 isoform X2 n=1 Tax=Malaya genurostris TaxID=325434 RepID=UPI0026F3C6A2|nr:uncharacterized protein LOC131431613 isoform X2 [Malaya genurostris]